MTGDPLRVRVRVTAVQGRHAFAVAEQSPACHGCGGCGAGVLSVYMARRARHHAFHNTLGARVGDYVELGIARAAVLYAALLGYGVPLIALLLGMTAASWLGAATGAAAFEAVDQFMVGPIGGTLMLAFGFALFYHFLNSIAC